MNPFNRASNSSVRTIDSITEVGFAALEEAVKDKGTGGWVVDLYDSGMLVTLSPLMPPTPLTSSESNETTNR